MRGQVCHVTSRGCSQVLTNTYIIRDFLRMNLPVFSGPKVEEDPNGFIDEVYKTLAIRELTLGRIVTCRVSIERCGPNFL